MVESSSWLDDAVFVQVMDLQGEKDFSVQRPFARKWQVGSVHKSKIDPNNLFRFCRGESLFSKLAKSTLVHKIHLNLCSSALGSAHSFLIFVFIFKTIFQVACL